MFEENRRNGSFETDEFWLPIKDISVSSTTQSSLASVSTRDVRFFYLETMSLDLEFRTYEPYIEFPLFINFIAKFQFSTNITRNQVIIV